MKAKIKKLEKFFLVELEGIGVELSENAVCLLSRSGVSIGIISTKKDRIIEFASDVDISQCDTASLLVTNIKYKIEIGSSGSFDPKNKASYWRTIHAASILKNWMAVCRLIDKYTLLIKKLEQ
jgi:hypothetical protein